MSTMIFIKTMMKLTINRALFFSLGYLFGLLGGAAEKFISDGVAVDCDIS